MAQQETVTGIGLRHVRIALRDTDGTIEVPAGTPVATGYNGLRISGAQALTVTVPDPQRVVARGDDRPYYTFQLPPTEGPTGELRVSKSAAQVLALITGTKVFGSPPVRKAGIATDKAGEEKAVLLWGSQQAIDSEEGSASFGQQVWMTYVLLNALLALRPSAMEDATVDIFVYGVAANDAAVDEFGTTFTSAVHGFTKCPYILVVTKNKFMLDAFIGDGATKAFTLSETPSEHADSILVAAVGGVVTAAYSVAGNVITFSAAPADDAKIIVEYEYD